MTLRRNARAGRPIHFTHVVFFAVAILAAVLLLVALSTVFGGVHPAFREPLPL